MLEITDLHGRLVANLRLATSVFLNGDQKSAQELLAQKVLVRDLERAYSNSHLVRLAGNTIESIETSSLHLDLIADLRRINSHFCSVAYPILEQAGVLAQTRLMTPPPAESLPDEVAGRGFARQRRASSDEDPHAIARVRADAYPSWVHALSSANREGRRCAACGASLARHDHCGFPNDPARNFAADAPALPWWPYAAARPEVSA